MRRLVPTGLCVIAFGLASVAAAQDEPPPSPVADALRVESTDLCLTLDALAGQVAAWLRRDEVDARISVTVRSRQGAADPGARSTVIEVFRDGEPVSERSVDLDDAECRERVAALGLFVALAIDATIVSHLHAPAPSRAVAAPEPTGDDPADAVESGLPPAPEGGARVGLAIDGALWLGLLPRPAGAISLALELAPARWLSVTAGILAAFGEDAPLAAGSVSSMLVAGSLEVCGGGDVAPVRLEGCAGLVSGPVIARGSGFPANEEALVAWGAASVAARARVLVTPWLGLRLAVTGVFPVVPVELAVLEADGSAREVITLPPAALGLSLGTIVIFS